MQKTTLLGSLLLLMGLLPTPGLPGQEPKPRPDEQRATVKKKVETMRKAMREGKIRLYNVRVLIRLNNNNRIKGIVKNGRFVELHDGLDFVPADRSNLKAGLRVYYYNGTSSFIFLPYAEIAYYKIGQRLTDAQVKAIEHKIVEEEKRQARLRQATLAKRKARAEKAGKAEGEPAAEENANPENPPVPGGRKSLVEEIPSLSPEHERLLRDFPPKDGWGPDKMNKLKVRRITLGVYPNEREKLFEKSFKEWEEALAAKKAIDAAKGEAKSKPAPMPAPAPTPTPKATKKPGPQPDPMPAPPPVPGVERK